METSKISLNTSAKLLALSALAVIMPATSFAEEDSEYHLVWQELFDAEELNPLRWDIEVNGDGGGNHELQYYTDRAENVSLGFDDEGNHCLILTARRESYNGKAFTSGRVNSKGRIAFTHGKIEASIKLPKTANGLWPAFWMMGNDYDEVGWPRCGEIDILEMGHADGIKAGSQERYFNGACHWGPGWPNASYAKASTKSYSLQDGKFHLYTMVWDAQSIKMYVDLDVRPVQNPYYAIDIPCDSPEEPYSAGNYFHKDNFILFNLAVGGDFPGIHDPAQITALNSDNGNAASMYGDYVKIYQKGTDDEHTDFYDPGDMASIPDMANDNYKIEYHDSILTSTEKDIAMYSILGSVVARSDNGLLSTEGCTPGIYIARTNHSTKKILVR